MSAVWAALYAYPAMAAELEQACNSQGRVSAADDGRSSVPWEGLEC
jgi:hypothetical protein